MPAFYKKFGKTPVLVNSNKHPSQHRPSTWEARQTLPPDILTLLNQAILSFYIQDRPLDLWDGHLVFAANGSKINLPRQLLDCGYKAPNHY